ncbi:MAG TPA: KEOPS complex subunit Pcc1 [Candidatus Bathyarchaeia archaeon]|jgi:hypothetical protein|nr:KEOPS complex subunit Pcc1 [Candidatus Bathyarchaeia archaeon]
MIRADIKLATRDKATSRSLVLSVQPDNIGLKGLTVKGKALDHAVSFRLEFNGKIETFISTLDDLLRCLQAASGTLENISD